MPRLKQVALHEVRSPRVRLAYAKQFGERDPVAEPGTNNGTPGNWWTVFALEPALFEMMLDRHEWQFSGERRIAPLLRELGIARAGWARESKFVFSQHCKRLRAEGASEEQIAAIPYWSSADCFTNIERAVLGYADDLVLSGGRSSDERFRQLQSELSDVAILELTYMICTYDMSAKISRALRLEYDDIEERVVEV
jgi:alkylhydroperoxidase family enzyme